jgi:hypothetical protein
MCSTPRTTPARATKAWSFSDLSDLLQAGRDQGVSTESIAPVQAHIERQIAAGHGQEAFERIYEETRSSPT